MTTKPDEKIKIPLNRKLKFKSLKGKRVRFGSHIRLKQTTNNGGTIMYFSCQEKEKKEKTQTIDD
jgi:hypothetical protein